MYDDVNAAAIPSDARIVAGYVDGLYRWSDADWNRFPKALHIRIAVFPSTNDGDVLDCETGDATPTQCPAWVNMRRTAGLVQPTVYVNRSTLPAVRNAFQAGVGIPEPDYWVADWGPRPGAGTPHLEPGWAACQYDHDLPFDISITADWWPRGVY